VDGGWPPGLSPEERDAEEHAAERERRERPHDRHPEFAAGRAWRTREAGDPFQEPQRDSLDPHASRIPTKACASS
jgi:hypothetical protein